MRSFEIPKYPSIGLGRVNRECGRTRAEEIIDFCSEPRSSKEIFEHFGVKASNWMHKAYLKPLVDDGRLRLTHPYTYSSCRQRFVNNSVDINIPTEQSILEFCRLPKTKRQIIDYFCIGDYPCHKIIKSLIDKGLLVGEDMRNHKNAFQKFVACDSEFNITKAERIIEFCREPRTVREIATHFGINIKYVRNFVRPLKENGQITLRQPDRPAGTKRQYISPLVEAKIISKKEIAKYCIVPRSRKEVAEHFDLKIYIARRYLSEMVAEEALRFTNPLYPAAHNQTYVISDSNVATLTEENLLEFCQTPRSLPEVAEHFGITPISAWHYLRSIREEGKLINTRPHKSKRQRVVTAGYWTEQ